MERNTRQRGAIRRALQRASRPLTPNEILGDARHEVAGLGVATVYRNIRALLEERWLVAVELVGEPARYELAGRPHHHHFRCRICERVFDVPCTTTSFDDVLPEGFRLEKHEVVLHGRCAECSGRGE
jgi:Fur family ferric uptake transcriptional regulator